MNYFDTIHRDMDNITKDDGVINYRQKLEASLLSLPSRKQQQLRFLLLSSSHGEKLEADDEERYSSRHFAAELTLRATI